MLLFIVILNGEFVGRTDGFVGIAWKIEAGGFAKIDDVAVVVAVGANNLGSEVFNPESLTLLPDGVVVAVVVEKILFVVGTEKIDSGCLNGNSAVVDLKD